MAKTNKLSITPKILTFIAKRIKDGATEGTIAEELGVTRTTFSRFKLNNPEVQEVVESAQQNIESEVVGFLMQMIRNPNHKNHASSVYFYLKTRCRWRETDPIPVTINAPDGMRFRLIADEDIAKAKDANSTDSD